MVGEFKDDQLQDHVHSGRNKASAFNQGASTEATRTIEGNTGNVTSSARHGDVSRGKRKGVKFIIKVL